MCSHLVSFLKIQLLNKGLEITTFTRQSVETNHIILPDVQLHLIFQYFSPAREVHLHTSSFYAR